MEKFSSKVIKKEKIMSQAVFFGLHAVVKAVSLFIVKVSAYISTKVLTIREATPIINRRSFTQQTNKCTLIIIIIVHTHFIPTLIYISLTDPNDILKINVLFYSR